MRLLQFNLDRYKLDDLLMREHARELYTPGLQRRPWSVSG